MRIFILQAIGVQAVVLLCDVMHDYKWIFNPDKAGSEAEKVDLLQKQISFNYFYLLVEAISLTVGSYFILNYNKILVEEYKYTKWEWKFLIFTMLMLLANW